jgi:hypothetical protein
MSAPGPASSSRNSPPPVLILCADEGLAEELVRELAGRRYQPLVGRPWWSWAAALEWARPVAAIVDTRHPAARSDGFLTASDDLDVGVVVVGEPTPAVTEGPRVRAIVRTTDVRLISGAVDAVRRQSA